MCEHEVLTQEENDLLLLCSFLKIAPFYANQVLMHEDT